MRRSWDIVGILVLAALIFVLATPPPSRPETPRSRWAGFIECWNGRDYWQMSVEEDGAVDLLACRQESFPASCYDPPRYALPRPNLTREQMQSLALEVARQRFDDLTCDVGDFTRNFITIDSLGHAVCLVNLKAGSDDVDRFMAVYRKITSLVAPPSDREIARARGFWMEFELAGWLKA